MNKYIYFYLILIKTNRLTDRLKGRMKQVYVVLLSLSAISFAYFVIMYGGWIKADFFQLHDGFNFVSKFIILNLNINSIVL